MSYGLMATFPTTLALCRIGSAAFPVPAGASARTFRGGEPTTRQRARTIATTTAAAADRTALRIGSPALQLVRAKYDATPRPVAGQSFSTPQLRPTTCLTPTFLGSDVVEHDLLVGHVGEVRV